MPADQLRYRIDFEVEPAMALLKIPNPDRTRIVRRIEALGDDPRPAGCEKLKGLDAWRVRQGNYRIVYTIDDVLVIVTITRIAQRGKAYR